jgi:hypothetical protein
MDGTVRVWDTLGGRETLTLKGDRTWGSRVAFSPDSKRLAFASSDRTVRVWDARTGQETFTLRGQTDARNSVAFSPDSERLAFGDSDGTVRVWDALSGHETLTLKGHARGVLTVAFSPDGKYLASGGFDRSVRIWDTRTGQNTVTLKGHGDDLHGVAFSPDGQRLASGSMDGTVKLWDTRTGQEALSFKGHTGFLRSVAFSPDGQRLFSTCQNGILRVWDATPVRDTSNRQRQALCYFRFLAETVVLKDEMLQQIRQTPMLTESAREQALEFAGDYREIPDRLNEASWSVVSRSWARPGAFALALRQAKAACDQEPDNGLFVRTLRAAQYRTGDYDAALKTLTQSDKHKKSQPADLAFLAMTQSQLGQKVEAAATLGRLRETIKQLPFDREAEELLKEAEGVVEAKK